MGTWGTGLFEDDVAADAQAMFEEAVGAGASPASAAEQVMDEWGEAAQDPDDGPVLVLALASLLLDHGVREHPLLREARRVIDTGAGLERWQEQGPQALAERQMVYQQLTARLQEPPG